MKANLVVVSLEMLKPLDEKATVHYGKTHIGVMRTDGNIMGWNKK